MQKCAISLGRHLANMQQTAQLDFDRPCGGCRLILLGCWVRHGRLCSVKSQCLQQICNYRSCLQWKPCDRLGQGKGHWSRIRQIWQTHKEDDMDQEDRQHESRRGELPIEPRMGQALTYWRLLQSWRRLPTWRRNVDNKVCYLVV